MGHDLEIGEHWRLCFCSNCAFTPSDRSDRLIHACFRGSQSWPGQLGSRCPGCSVWEFKSGRSNQTPNHRGDRHRKPARFSTGNGPYPAGALIAATPHLVVIDDHVFPEARQFRPGHCLDADAIAEAHTPCHLEMDIVMCGNGSRNCIGMHLACAQLFMSVVCGAAVRSEEVRDG